MAAVGEIYSRIVEACRERDVYPSLLCDKLGFSRSILTELKNRSSMSTEKLEKFAEALNVSCDYLISGKEFEYGITQEEHMLLDAYHHATQEERETICFMLRKYGMPLPEEQDASLSTSETA
jgi:transcriptional regulator with XRE-family HTH domain